MSETLLTRAPGPALPVGPALGPGHEWRRGDETVLPQSDKATQRPPNSRRGRFGAQRLPPS